MIVPTGVFDGEMKAVDQTMRRADEFDSERTKGDHIARLDSVQQHVAKYSMLVQLAFRQAEGEVRCVNRNVDLLQHIRQRTEMIFVAMRENNGQDFVPVLFENFKIRNTNIDAIDALFGKTHARVQHEHLVAEAQQSTVHPELADTAEGNNFEDVSH